MALPDTRRARRNAIKTIIAVATLIVLLMAYLGWLRPHQDTRRMDAIAVAVRKDVKPGMTVDDAIGVLDRLGLEHSGVVPSVDDAEASNSEKSVIYSLIRHNAQPWSFVFRDVQVRIYIDGEGVVGRTDVRDVFTGP